MTKKNIYTEDSIQSLTPLEFTRLRPGVYVGSTEYSTQLVIEAVSNAVDEFQAGHGSKIKVTITKDDTFIVEDEGQGFLPNVKREDGKTILEAAFSVLNTSAKYSDDGVYEGISLGVNGVGAKLIVYLSHWAEVLSWRDGKYEHLWFKEGVFQKRDVGKWSNKSCPSGTLIQWQPNEEFFTHPEADMTVLTNLFRTLCGLCPGLHIILNDKDYYSEHGLNDLIDAAIKDKEVIKTRFNLHYQEAKNKIDMAMTYTSAYTSTIIPYVNTGLTETGPHIGQIKALITREMNRFFREKEWLKEKEDNLSGDDCQEGMYMVFNLTTTGVSYDAQTKANIVKLDMTPFTPIIVNELRNWLSRNEKDIKIIFDKAIAARRAREAARKARDAARKPKEKGLKAKLALSSKFTDCISKDPNRRNLLLVEGNSAAASAVEARNVQTDCIYQLRGKIISPLRTPTEKILQNQEMSDIIKVIGGGFGKDFDVDKINFNKIVITSDADSDGFDIELLLITFFYTYMRPLVEAGKLYRAVTPLYIVRQANNEYYCYSDEELEDWKQAHNGSYDILRAKGLGELNAEDLQKVCFLNERYKRITISDIEASTQLLNILQGPQVEPRKQYIYDNAERLGFNFD